MYMQNLSRHDVMYGIQRTIVAEVQS